MNNQKTKEIVLIEDLGYMYPTEASKQKARYGIYMCHCGNEFKAQIYSIKSGNTKSCGCFNRQNPDKSPITHGMSNTRIYNIWCGIIKRCTNPKHNKFHYYGGRGITFCDKWKNFEGFYEDMKDGYDDSLSIDRIDYDGNYCKENCRWATNALQARNTRLIGIKNTTGYRGVHFHKRNGKFIAHISVDNKSIHIGSFDSAIDGAIAYDKYVIHNNLEHTINNIAGVKYEH